MEFKDTYFGFFQENCLHEFGENTGKKIYVETYQKFNSYLADADYRDNRSIKKHMQKNIFPMMAYYLTLQSNGYDKEDAYNKVLSVTQKFAHATKDFNKKTAKIPCIYSIFKLLCKAVMKRDYPVQGWEKEWIQFDRNAIHVNYKTCLYVDVTAQYNCPELCTVFCKNDVTVFAGYMPKIVFERHKTLAEGGPYCDFHFINGNHIQNIEKLSKVL